MSRILTCLLLLAAATASADTLVLKSGKKYSGVITRPEPGKFAIRTSLGLLQFDENVVAMDQMRFTPPSDARNVSEMLKDERYAAALPLVETWLERYADLPTPWYERALYFAGLCRANTGEEDAAARAFSSLLEKFPDSQYKSDAQSRLIDLQLSGAEGEELKDKLQAIIDSPGSGAGTRAMAHKNLGKYLESQGDLPAALENYATVVVLYGDIDEGDLQETAQARCADLFLELGRTNEATFYYRQIVEVYPDGAFTAHAREQLSTLTTDTGE